MTSMKIVVTVSVVAVGLFAFAIGVIIGFFSGRSPACKGIARESTGTSSVLIRSISASNIEENLKYFTSVPHIGGSPREKSNAEFIRDEWQKQGLDSAKLIPYDVLLSYPNPDNPNKISIIEDGNEIFHTALEEEILREEDRHPDVVPPFNAYSVAAQPEGDLVYANYARVEDFEYLADNYPTIDLTDTIIIARYGKVFRGNKALNAQAAGAKGLILYSDPADYAIDGDISLYPEGWWLPETGCQRGNIWVSDAKGDPVTPGFPAKDYAYRMADEDTALPKIPVHPIGYGDARRLLSEMRGPLVSEADGWKGHLNVTYRIGPGFTDPQRKAKMNIYTTRETRTTYDVIGYIRGDTEPDRYVVLGNHRDAWVYGSTDPSSGTATIMEVSRAFGERVKDGWRPRRSILFTSWGSEEYGLLGSTEYVEEFQKILGERAVAYLNVDGSVSGNYSLKVKSTPLLYNAIYEAAKQVPDPEDLGTSSTLYDSWKERLSPTEPAPRINNLGSGSDFAPFMYRVGVPAVDMRYSYDPSLGISSYPVYHSVYETFYYMKSFLDYNFYRHQAVARIWTELSRDLADSVILPMNCTDYAIKISGSMQLVKDAYEERMNREGITFEYIDSALENFTAGANDLHDRIKRVNLNSPLEVRQLNDQLMQLERAFIEPLGLPDRKFLRHLVFAPSNNNYYAADAFPGIVDAMFNIDEDPDQETRWRIVKEQMAITAFIIQSAASTLVDVLQF